MRHRAPEKVFGLMDMHENLDALLPTLTDMIDGKCWAFNSISILQERQTCQTRNLI